MRFTSPAARRIAVAALAAVCVAVPLASFAASKPATIGPLLWQSGMPRSAIGEINVFRRFSMDRTDAMRAFYGEVLALPVLPATALGGDQMIRYPVGASEVKLFPVAPSEPSTAAVGAVIGVRLLTFFFADQDALVERFAQLTQKPPEFRAITSRPGAKAAALTQDPDGGWVELVVIPGADAAALARFEIGIVVGDFDKSRAFYRDLLGLEEGTPVRDELVRTQRHPYTHGATTINLYAFGADLPKDVQTGGMQYIVWSASKVNDVAQARGAAIDRPLSAAGQMRTIWLTDPDGVSNYFAEFSGNDNRPRKAR